MSYDVFISHSSRDKTIADAICGTLEAQGVRCWMAPRDIAAGQDWPERIIEALNECSILVLVFSSHANQSKQVRREVHHAFSRGITVIPFRLERVELEKSLQYFMESVHWLDALTPPLEVHLQQLAVTAKSILASRKTGPADGAVPPPAPAPPPPPPPPPPPVTGLVVRVTIVAVLCTLGVFLCSSMLLNALSPSPGSPEQTVFTHFPLVRKANIFANGFNLPLNVLILAGCWLAYRNRKIGSKIIRRGAIGITVVTALWVFLVLLAGVTAPVWDVMSSADRTTYLTNTFGSVLLPFLSLGVIWFLFRRDEA